MAIYLKGLKIPSYLFQLNLRDKGYAKNSVIGQLQEKCFSEEVAQLTGVPYPKSKADAGTRKASLRPLSNLYILDLFADSEVTVPHNIMYLTLLPDVITLMG